MQWLRSRADHSFVITLITFIMAVIVPTPSKLMVFVNKLIFVVALYARVWRTNVKHNNGRHKWNDSAKST